MRILSSSKAVSSLVFQVVLVGAFALLFASLVARASISVSLGIVVALVLCAVFLQRPDLGLLLVLFARASSDVTFRLAGGLIVGGDTIERFSIGALPNIVLILTLVFGGGIFILARGVRLIGLPGGRLLALLLLTGLVGVLRSENTLLALNEWIPVVAAFVVYSLAAGLFSTPRSAQKVVNTLAASFVLPALLGFYQLLTRQGIEAYGTGIVRITGTFVHPNTFGEYLVFMLSVFVCQALFRSGSHKVVPFLIVATSVPLILATFARAAWAGAITVLLTVGLLRSRRLLLMVILLAVAAFVSVPPIRVRLADQLSLADRVYNLWPAILREWLGATSANGNLFSTVLNRLGGLGPGAGHLLSLRGYGGFTEPHNDYLRVLVEYGIFGLVCFAALIVVLVRYAFQAWREARDDVSRPFTLGFFALAIAFSMMSLTENIFASTANQVYFWTLAGLAVAANELSVCAICRPIDAERIALRREDCKLR